MTWRALPVVGALLLVPWVSRPQQAMWFACLAVVLLAGCVPIDRPGVSSVVVRDVSFDSAGYRLVGTLTSPGPSRSATAGILIIGGSGPINRDGVSRSAMSTPPVYRQWAEALSAAGFAVLRYDKRFVTHPVDLTAFDQEAQIADALSAVTLLRSAPETVGTPIVIVGHSEGGTLAPIVAERAGAIAGVVVVNAVVFPVDELLIAQLDANPTVPKRTVADVRHQLDRVKDGSFPRHGLLLGAGPGYWKQWIELSAGSLATLSRLPVALLLVQSSSDETLPGESLPRNLEILRTVAGRKRSAELRELSGHDHFGQRPGQREPSAEFVEVLVGWLRRVGR